jgi:thioredoxin reductase (NADPH)
MSHTNLTVYGATWCSDCKRAKKFLGEQRVHYNWVDVEQDTDGLALVERVNKGKRIIPTIMFEDQSILVEPNNAELAAKLGLQTRARMNYYDLIIVGGGPTGLTTALYAAREGLDVLVIEKSGLGGQAGVTERLDNFPGFPEGIGGAEFADRLAQQARRFGVEMLQAQEVTGLRAEAESRYVATGDGAEYGARAVLIATGSTYRRLGVPGEGDLIGAGVHFCATCDGPFYKGKHVAVIGGGNSAGEESLFLTRFAEKITILVRGEAMTASKIVLDKVAESRKIEVLYNTEVRALQGDNQLSGLTIHNSKTGVTEEIAPAGVFVFIGLSPNSGWVPGEVKRDQYGFITTDATLATSMRGVFAAGDVRKGSTKQAASAAGEGATAALMIREYLKEV